MKRKMLMMSLVAGLMTTISLSVFATSNAQSKYITKSKAKAIALQHAGLKESEVKFVNGYISYDDGRAEYEIEFWKDNKEYDYEIDAITGKILSYDYDIESYSISSKREQINSNPYIPQEKKDLINSKLDIKESMIQQTATGNTANNYITKSKAKAIALQHAGLKESDVTFVNGYLSYDDGRAEYEIEFWKDNKEYDYEIDAITGNILSYDYDIESYVIPSIGVQASMSTQEGKNNYITESKAKAIALQHAGLNESEVRIKKVKFDYDDGRAEYEVEFRKGRMEYEYIIDAVNGTILEFDMDND